MKIHSERKRRANDAKHGCHRSLILCMKKSLDQFYIYCDNTTLHGFRYITINGSTIIERIFWFAACISAIVFCIVLMQRLWQSYSENPIATFIDSSNPIWELPFPAVTICNNNKVYRPHADIVAKNLYMNGFSTDESDKFFSSLMKLIRPDKISTDNITASQVLDNLNITVETLMLQLMQPCSSMLVRCAWIGKIHDCNKIFKIVKSREGFCCAFNSHYSSNHNNTYNSEPEARNNSAAQLNVTYDDSLNVTEILKAPGSGRDLGLSVALNIEGEMYKATSRPYIGATVLINDPIDFPDIGAQVASVAPGHVLAISVTGSLITSMENMRSIPVEKRKCFFDDEKPGEIRYSYQTCVSECIAKYTHRLCDCLPFYFPKKHDGIRTCYLPDLNCLLAIRRSIPDYRKDCETCLPQCNDVEYNINIEDGKMDNVGYDSDITHGLDMRKVSFLYVYFGDMSYVEYRRESTINWDALLASFGGIFGLCLGGSVLSAIEAVYLLARQLLKKRFREGSKQSHASLPPASKMFLSIPVGKIQSQRPLDQQEADDKRASITWQQPTLQRRKTRVKADDARRKRGKF